MSILKKIKKSVTFRINHFFRDYIRQKKKENIHKYSFDYRDNIYLFTDPRSGSTWVMEMLSSLPKTATLWEPFHPDNGSFDNLFKLGWRPYVPFDTEWSELKVELDNVFSNRKFTDWTISRSSLKQYQEADKLIVKSVRANALLPWIVSNFNFNIKPIYMLRHPIAQSLSHIKRFSNVKDPHAEQEFDFSKEQVSEYFKEHTEFLKTLRTQLECRVAIWCITNYRTINSSLSSKWNTVHYENILISPEEEMKKILSELGSEPIDLETVLSKPSYTSSKSLKNDPKEQVEKWMHELSKDQKDRIETILEHFRVSNVYSAYSALPLS